MRLNYYFTIRTNRTKRYLKKDKVTIKKGKKPLQQHKAAPSEWSQYFSTRETEHVFWHGAHLSLTCRCCLWQCHAAAHTWMADFSCQALHLELTLNAHWLHWSWCHCHLLRTQSTEINTIWNTFFPPRWEHIDRAVSG